MSSGLNESTLVARLNRMNPVASQAKIGDVTEDLITQHNALVAQYNLLLAHLDAANVTGIGNANASTYGVTNTIKTLSQR